MKAPAVQFRFRRPIGAPTHAPSEAMQDALRRLSQAEEMQPLLKKAQAAGVKSSSRSFTAKTVSRC